MNPLRIGTRGSPLALWQAQHVAALLRPLVAPRAVELIEIATSGDIIRDVALGQIGGEGLFTKEIQKALLANTVDVAVHSLKDLPTIPVEGLVLAAVPVRGPTGDVLVSRKHACFDALPHGARIATGSQRRRAQLRARRPDVQLVEIRGNVETRLRKLAEEDLDGLVLAQAGLERLGLQRHITEVLDPEWMLPAVGQGALGLECREADTATWSILRSIDHEPTRLAVLAERAFLRGLGGGCQVPVGVVSVVYEGGLHLRGVVLRADGSGRLTDETAGPTVQAEHLGQELADALLERGARALLGNTG
jgi:hydroxymethylbilane synthase